MTQDDDVEFRELASDKYGDRLENLSEDEVDSLEQTFLEKYEKFGDEKLALTSAIGSYNFEQNKGDSEEVLIYAVGFEMAENFQGGTLLCYGVLDDGDRSGRIVALAKRDEIDQSIDDLKEMWSDAFAPIRATLDIRSTDIDTTFVGEIATMGKKVFERDDEVEKSLEERRRFVNDHVPTTEIRHISDELTTLQTDSDFAAEFGVDFKRLEYATVLESNIGKSARYILQDDSFLEASELTPEVRGEDNEVGLEAWANLDIMTVETESIADVYGTITPNQEGMLRMSVYGYDGHYINDADIDPVDDSQSGASGGSSDESSASGQAIDERTI